MRVITKIKNKKGGFKMFDKMLKFLMTSIASLLLVACGAENMEASPNQSEETSQSTEIIENEGVETETPESEEVEEVEEETNGASTEADENEIAEDTEKENELTANEIQVNNREQALDHLLQETQLEKEDYSFYFVETDSSDYIEIEVREIQEDDEHASLEGSYRYMLESGELLMRDYLTGEFIPYSAIE